MGAFYEQFLKRESPTGVIFDVDGTLLDSMPVWAHSGERYLSSVGIKAPDTLGRALFSMTMQEGAKYIKETFAMTQTAQEIKDGIIKVVASAYQNETLPKPGAFVFLNALREAGIPMTVITSNDRPLIAAAFDRLGLEPYFKEIITCGEFGSGKDHPDIFHAAASRMNSNPASTWVAEDGLYAMRTAKKAGYRVIGVADACSRQDEAQIRQIADYFITDFTSDMDDQAFVAHESSRTPDFKK